MNLEIWFQGLTGAERGRNKCICPWMSNVWVRERMLIWEAYKDFRTFLMGAGCLEVKRTLYRSYVFLFFFLGQKGFRNTNRFYNYYMDNIL